MLEEGLYELGQGLTPYFKSLAKQLHPDKNTHPLAKEAFQKLNAAFEAVKTNLRFAQPAQWCDESGLYCY